MESDHADRLSADDAAILDLESASLTGHTLKIIVLEAAASPLDIDQLRVHVASRLGGERRASQRVEIGPDGAARWVDDALFDIDAHIDHYPDGAPTGAPGGALCAVAGSLMQQRLDHRRPLWRLDLIGPLSDGSEVIVARIHHALADGMTAMRMLETLLWTGDPVENRPGLADHAPVPAPSAHGRTGELRYLPGVLRRELLAWASRTSLDQHVGAGRSVAMSFLSLSELRRIAHSRNPRATVNDVLLAVVAGALPRWAPLARSSFTRLRAQVPVSLHQRIVDENQADAANMDSFLNVDLPVHETDPLARVDRLRDETSLRKRFDDAAELYDFFHAVSRLSRVGPALSRLTSSPHEWSVSISNIPGPSRPVSVLGRRVRRLCSVAEPADHHALRVSAISAADMLAVGLCTDPSALSDVDQLATAIDEEFGNLRSLVNL